MPEEASDELMTSFVVMCIKVAAAAQGWSTSRVRVVTAVLEDCGIELIQILSGGEAYPDRLPYKPDGFLAKLARIHEAHPERPLFDSVKRTVDLHDDNDPDIPLAIRMLADISDLAHHRNANRAPVDRPLGTEGA